MLKMIKYLKKSTGAILAIVLLLVVQASSDLSLPQYTANIVNVGIKQSGVENAVPNVIRKSELDKLFIFMDDNEKSEVLNNYQLFSKDTITDEELKESHIDYEKLSDEDFYSLNTKDKEKIKELNSIFSRPMMISAMFKSDNEESSAIKSKMMKDMLEKQQSIGAQNNTQSAQGKLSKNQAVSPSGLPVTMTDEDIKKIDMFELLSKMPKDEVNKIKTQIYDVIDAIPETMIEQSATSFVQSEYEAIGVDMESLEKSYMFITAVKMIGLALISMAATISVAYLASRVAARLGRDLRSKVFDKVISFSNTEFDKFSTASLITRSTNDIQQIQQLMVMLLRVVFYAPILGIGGIIKVFSTDSSMAWIIGVAVLTIIGIVMVMFGIAMPKFKMVQKLVDKVNLVMRERLTGLMVVRAFSTEKHEEERFDAVNNKLTKTNLFVNRVMTMMMPLMTLVMNIITILIVWNGAKAIDIGSMQVGDMLAFIQYTMQIIMSFIMISMLSIMLPTASVSANRIEEVLSTDVSIKNINNVEKFDEDKKGVVEFKNVSFKYPNADENVLDNISFTAMPGKTTAFIGSTGSGKSTLINLIPRFYDVTSGEILVDGKNVKSVSQHDLREKIGFVPQKGVLFSGTIESNIKYGKKDASDSEVQVAAEVAQASDFISANPMGFKADISQGGSNVSGGQKQRLSIARAIAKSPEIYIFDDSFSALDFKTDAALRKALGKYTGESTVLIVAQRISTIMHADEIIVIDEGKIVGIGSHKELLKNCDVYRQIALSQLSKEELDNE